MIDTSITVEKLKNAAKSDNKQELIEELNNIHYADLSEVFLLLTPEERLEYFELLPEEKAADLMEELNPQIQVELLDSITQDKAARIILHMPHDSVADFLADLSDTESESYLAKLPSRVSSQIRELLSYDEESAGGLMNSEVLRVNESMNVGDTLEYIRKMAESERVDFYYIYVVDRTNHLRGVLSLRKLITSPSYIKVEEIMATDVIKVNVTDDQETVADTVIKYGFLAIPVVDDYNKLKGIITWDDAQEVSEEEATEDFYASSGITTDIDEDEILLGRISQSVRARTPWLFITLIGEFVAVNVANHFNYTLEALPIIAIFMPLLAGLGGNIGTQSITIIVRGLSTGQISLGSSIYHVFRELRVGLLIGLLFGVIVALTTFIWKGNYVLGIVVGLAMIINMTLAALLGTVTPFVLKKFDVDPAVASGPFIATTIDVLGLAIYFSLVTVSLRYMS